MRSRQPKPLTDEEYEIALAKYNASLAGLGRNRFGRWEAVESVADEMLRRALKGVTKYADKSDIMTPWKQDMRWRREIPNANGIADPSVRRGMYHRAANPLKPELNCHRFSTKVVIRDVGLVEIGELIGTVQEVYTSKGWNKAEFYCFGEDQMYEVTLTQYGKTRVIGATANHRWFTLEGSSRRDKRGSAPNLPKKTEKNTLELLPGTPLVSQYIPSLVGQTNPSSFGICHGFVFGDGTIKYQRNNSPRYKKTDRSENGTYVDLFGEKVFCMLKYFPRPRFQHVDHHINVEEKRIVDLPTFMKRVPPLDESVSYLYGWLAGYFAADGNVTESGDCQLHSQSLSNLLFVQNLCYRLGITVNQPTLTTNDTNPWSGKRRELWQIVLDKWALTKPFFCIDEHQRRWVDVTSRAREKKLPWVVQEITQVGVEPIYCAVVPSTEDFVIEDYILTGNSRLGTAYRARTSGSVTVQTESIYTGAEDDD